MDESNDETSLFSLLLFPAFAPIAQHHYSHFCARRERRRRNAREDLQFHSELTGSTRRWNRLIKRKIFLHHSDAESTTKNMRRTWTKAIVRQKSESDSRVKNSFSTFFISSPSPYPFLHSFLRYVASFSSSVYMDGIGEVQQGKNLKFMFFPRPQRPRLSTM